MSQLKQLLEPFAEKTSQLLNPIAWSECDRVRIAVFQTQTDADANENVDTAENVREHFSLDFYSERNGTIGYPSYACDTFLSRLSEKRESKHYGRGRLFIVPTVDMVAVLINELIPPSQIEFADDSARLTYQNLLASFLSTLDAAKARSDYKLKGILPPIPKNFVNTKIPLMEHQLAGVLTTIRESFAGFACEQGTGKTAMGICEIANLARTRSERNKTRKEPINFKALIVCPASLRMNWRDEISRFITCSYKLTILRGSKYNRVYQLLTGIIDENGEDACIVICSYDTLRSNLSQFLKISWDYVLLDESHYIKSPVAARTKAALKIRDKCRKRRIASGTMSSGKVKDLYSQLEFLHRGASGFSNYTAFSEEYEVYDDSNQYGGRLVGLQNLDRLHERLLRYTYRVTKAEALKNLPPKTYSVVEIEMTAEQRKAYQELLTKLMVEIEDEESRARQLGISPQVTANNILVKLLRLTQVTSGFMKLDKTAITDSGQVIEDITQHGIDGFVRFKDNPKIAALLDIAAELPQNEKAIVWAIYTEDIRAITEALNKAGYETANIIGTMSDVQRHENVTRFNCKPECRFMVGNPDAGGVGLNLLGYDTQSNIASKPETSVTLTVYYSQNFKMTSRVQSEDRCHRKGTINPVHYIDLVVPNTIDEEIRKRVVVKRDMAETMQDVKAIMHSLAGVKLESEE